MGGYFWLILAVVLIVLEILTLGLTTIWFALGALAAFLASLCHAHILVQVAVFLIVSFVTLIFTRPVAKKYFNKDRVRTNVDSVYGQKAKVTERIDNINGAGAVMLNGQEWTARSEGGDVIEAGATVVVKGVSGVKLIVSLPDAAAEREDKK